MSLTSPKNKFDNILINHFNLSDPLKLDLHLDSFDYVELLYYIELEFDIFLTERDEHYIMNNDYDSILIFLESLSKYG